MTSKFYLILLSCFILKQGLVAQIVPPPATQTEVDAGLNRFKYVTPYTLANSGLISGPTNGVTAATATNIATSVATTIADTKQQGSPILTNAVGSGIATNGNAESFGISNGIFYSRSPEGIKGLQYWDNFQRPLLSAGVVPASPSGHAYRLIGSPASATTSEVGFGEAEAMALCI